MLRRTRWGLIVRTVGESADAARAMGYDVTRVRLLATMAGGFLAGVGGSFLSLFYPGSWNEGLSSGQGLMAVALVIFARWDPVRCLSASLLFGGASALGPALQSVGVTSGYYLFNAAPYALTLAIIIATSSRDRALAGQPAELRVATMSVAGIGRRVATVPLTVPPALEAIGVSQAFGSVRALDDVSLTLERGTRARAAGRERRRQEHAGQVHHGLLPGRRGPRAASAASTPRIESPRDAAGAGHRHGLPALHAGRQHDRRREPGAVAAQAPVRVRLGGRARRRSRAFMEKMPFRLDPTRPVRTLAAGEKQKLEILKQLYLGSSIVILDEPTSVLTPDEADEVLGLLRGMAQGRAA